MDDKNKQTDIKKSFAENLDSYLSNPRKRSNPLDVCETPNVLLAIGAEQLPVIMNPNDIDKCLSCRTSNRNKNSHDLTIEEMNSLPELLANPVMILQDPKNPNYKTVVTDTFDKDGQPFVIGIELAATMQRNTVNRVSTIYGRENAFEPFIAKSTGKEVKGFIPRNIDEGNLLAVNINKAPTFFPVTQAIIAVGGENIVSFDNSIPHSMASVKPFDEKSYEELKKSISAQKSTAAERPETPERNVVSLIKDTETRLKILDEQITAKENYNKCKPIVEAGDDLKGKRRDKYEREHTAEYIIFNAAKKTLDKHFPDKKFPRVKELREQKKELEAEKQTLYAEYRGSGKDNQIDKASKKAAELNQERDARKPPDNSRKKGDLEI